MIRNDCSTVYDHIPASFIKPVSEFWVSPITFIINNFIKINQFPDKWKPSRISPIPKIQLPVDLEDYRPVSILPILSKVYERVVLEQLTNFTGKKPLSIWLSQESFNCNTDSQTMRWHQRNNESQQNNISSLYRLLESIRYYWLFCFE